MTTDYAAVPDLARYPELVWLDRHPYLAAILLGVACWLIAGWPGLVVGFFWSTVALWHATFGINSLAHVLGRQRYVTGDDSRNNWLLAIVTLGEGWHNNHHACQSSVRQGFRWWEFDVTFYALKALSWLGIVWDLNLPAAQPGRRRAAARAQGGRARRAPARRARSRSSASPPRRTTRCRRRGSGRSSARGRSRPAATPRRCWATCTCRTCRAWSRSDAWPRIGSRARRRWTTSRAARGRSCWKQIAARCCKET